MKMISCALQLQYFTRNKKYNAIKKNNKNNIYLSDFVKSWPLGFHLAPGTARLQASPLSKKSRGLDVLVATAA